ncbi:MAG: serine--tRNA ligase [Candidatus Aenigmarchaeota archaeon]|nr:serine--tRNA ligase [Candidatus Aenigmarchaeota archaeon]
MLDIKLIRKNPELVRKNLERRNDPGKLELFDKLIIADKKWKFLVSETNRLRGEKNKISEEIAKLKKEGKDVRKKIEEAGKVTEKIEEAEEELKACAQIVKDCLLKLPNLLHESVPHGKDESDNVEIRRWGSPPKFDFDPKDHLTILKNLGLVDFERGAKVAGHQFYYMKNQLVLLDLAIQRFAIDFLLKKGFTLVEPPLMINRKAYEGMIDPTDFEMVTYKIEDEDFYLIATAEHPLGAMFMGEVFNKQDLPLRLCGVSACFRKEVGTHGKYTKGLFRVHQFNKVEQFIFCLPENSWELFEELQKNAEKLYQNLGLCYHVVNICTGDIGTIAAKKYDIECWMADGKFRETGSCSNCTDYQARRLNIRYREGPGKPVKGFIHTLNNTALATSRTIIAILEQYQQADGTIKIPRVLQKYMGGTKELVKVEK